MRGRGSGPRPPFPGRLGSELGPPEVTGAAPSSRPRGIWPHRHRSTLRPWGPLGLPPRALGRYCHPHTLVPRGNSGHFRKPCSRSSGSAGSALRSSGQPASSGRALGDVQGPVSWPITVPGLRHWCRTEFMSGQVSGGPALRGIMVVISGAVPDGQRPHCPERARKEPWPPALPSS